MVKPTLLQAILPKSVNKVVRVFSVPCAPTPQIWIECAVPALITAVWSLAPIDKKSVLRILTGKTWLKHVKQYVEESKTVTPAFFDGLLLSMFEIAEFVDMAMWYLFLAEIGLEFIAEWTSLVWKMSGCTHQKQEATQCGDAPYGTILANTGWQLGWAWVEQYPTPGAVMASGVHIPAGTQATIAVACDCHDLLGIGMAYGMRIVNMSSGKVVQETHMTAADHDNGKSAIALANVTADLFFSTMFEVQFLNEDDAGRGLWPGNGRITIYQGPANDWYGHL